MAGVVQQLPSITVAIRSEMDEHPQRLLYDKAADADWLCEALDRREVELVTPHRSNRKKPRLQDGAACGGTGIAGTSNGPSVGWAFGGVCSSATNTTPTSAKDSSAGPACCYASRGFERPSRQTRSDEFRPR
jgi:hypothetical protein